jgi:hypothetical protein
MKQNFAAFFFAIIFLLCARPADAVVCAPAKLVHLVTVDVTPGIPAGSFGAQPRVMYRIGSDRVRIEEAPDVPGGIHGVVVMAEPNIWMANLFDHTGKHIVDPGPTFYAKAPIFYGTPGLSTKLIDLEFGCEAEFIAANAPAPVRSEQIGADRFDVYRVDGGSDAVEILERSGTSIPSYVRYYQQGKLLEAIRYDLYVTGLPNDPNLFVPPSGVRYSEAGSGS